MRRRLLLSIAFLVVALVVAVESGAQFTQYYVLDGFGGVHAGGGAPGVSQGTPYFGFDVAKDIAYLPFGVAGSYGDGVLVLDAFGGVHAGGAIVSTSANPRPPYFGFNIARAITYRNIPPRAIGSGLSGIFVLENASLNYTQLISLPVHAPDDGLVLVNASIQATCVGVDGSATGDVAIGFNSTQSNTVYQHFFTFPDCSLIGPALDAAHTSVALSGAIGVTAGTHTFNLLVRKAAGNRGLDFRKRAMTVLFVDQTFSGAS